ncbi:MAG TPA: deoxyguanosinetriphosphate triphosphohydrolase [Clostridiales bacterium]|jgi:dGTPase|nr:deoxyguanosinetriphosphate triphosphohydrolase [Clostridiales bacterium]
MLAREHLERQEYEYLSPYAAKSADSRGRKMPEEPCSMRTDFQRDRDRIIHSKSLRRLMHKTQVFLAPEGDHFRTRLTHTLEVAQIARTCARALALNEDLTEAIAMGHDLGHTPFGHNGEVYLNERHPGGFQHNVQSLRVVDVLDRNHAGRSMNLTEEVRDGILNHTGKGIPFTLEGQVVRMSDRIAYINHDIDDAIRGRIICAEELPADCIAYLGPDHRSRIDALVRDLVRESDGKDGIFQSEEAKRYMDKLRAFMFERVYHSPIVKQDSELDKIRHLVFSLYDYYLENPDLLPCDLPELLENDSAEELVKDHIASMTDRYAINVYTAKFLPTGWKIT